MSVFEALKELVDTIQAKEPMASFQAFTMGDNVFENFLCEVQDHLEKQGLGLRAADALTYQGVPVKHSSALGFDAINAEVIYWKVVKEQ